MGFGVYYTITTIRNPQNPFLILKALQGLGALASHPRPGSHKRCAHEARLPPVSQCLPGLLRSLYWVLLEH